MLGTPIANRTRPSELEPLIGFFVNTLALRVRFDDDPTFLDLLTRVKRTTLDAFEHQDFPFEKLVEGTEPGARYMSRSPLFQVMLVLQNAPRSRLEMGGVRVLEPLELRKTSHGGVRPQPCSFTEIEKAGSSRRASEYSLDLFDRSTIARLVEHWRVLLEAICENPAMRCAELPLLTHAERQHVARRMERDTESEYSQGRSLPSRALRGAEWRGRRRAWRSQRET